MISHVTMRKVRLEKLSSLSREIQLEMGSPKIGNHISLLLYKDLILYYNVCSYQSVLKDYVPFSMNQSFTEILRILVLSFHSVQKQLIAATEPLKSTGFLLCQPPRQGPQDSCCSLAGEFSKMTVTEDPSQKIIQQYQYDLYRHFPITCTS